MIYLFNSAFLPTYLENVYRIVGQPDSSLVRIRYTIGQNAPPREMDEVATLSPCVISYINRFAPGQYVYHPIRYGLIRKVWRDQSRVYYEVELRGYCHAPDPAAFTATILEVPEAPRLTNGDVENIADGSYCIRGPEPQGLVASPDTSWSTTVDQLYATPKFAGDVPTFYRCTVRNKARRNLTGNEFGMAVQARRRYFVDLSYRYPVARIGEPEKKLLVAIDGGMEHELRVGASADQSTFIFTRQLLDSPDWHITITSIAGPRAAGQNATSYKAEVRCQTALARFLLAFVIVMYVACLLPAIASKQDVSPWLLALLDVGKFVLAFWLAIGTGGKLRSLPS